jgi:hypothetical protein
MQRDTTPTRGIEIRLHAASICPGRLRPSRPLGSQPNPPSQGPAAASSNSAIRCRAPSARPSSRHPSGAQFSKSSVCQPRGARMSKIIKPLLPLALIGGFNLKKPKNHLRSQAKDKVQSDSPSELQFYKNVRKCPKMSQNVTPCNTNSRYPNPVARSFQPGRPLAPLPPHYETNPVRPSRGQRPPLP